MRAGTLAAVSARRQILCAALLAGGSWYGLSHALAAGAGAPGCPATSRPLFDGRSLDGWGGDTEGYAADGGILRCLPSCSGNLVTREQFGDFRLDLEFRLQPGSNNGIGIRAPFRSNPAYEGMEIQVLDDTLPRPGLRDVQRHGSIYGVVPADTGRLAPPGTWNRETIIADGTHIQVILNGAVIVDADVREAGEASAAGSGSHPGLLRRKGHIHLCGHGDPVEFRAMCITELGR